MKANLGSLASTRSTFHCCGGCVLILGIAAGTLLGWDNDSGAQPMDQTSAAPDPASASRGRTLYSKHCLACHGPSGRGDGSAGRDLNPEPADLLQPDVLEKSDAQLLRQITRGRRPMPSFEKLPVEDRREIVHFIRVLAAGRHSGDGR